MFFDEPVLAGQGDNSKQAIRHVFGVAIACGLVASCSASSDFGSAMGLTQLAEQELVEEQELDGSSQREGVSAITTASVGGSAQSPDMVAPETLAFAYPTPRPAAGETGMTIEASAPVQQIEAVAVPPAPSAQPQKDETVAGSEPEASNQKRDLVETAAVQEAIPEKKKGFFSALFGGRSEQPVNEVAKKPATQPVQVAATSKAETNQAAEKKIVIDAAAVPSAYSASVLPGVRASGELFDITRKSNDSDDSDMDLYEEEGSYQVASAAGLARLAPNGLLRQREDVVTSCFKPELVRLLKTIERHYGKPVMVTSGYRSPAHNRRVRGARKSAHMNCAAADIQVAGVSRWELAKFARSLQGRGGVGTYCHTASVHVDVGAERDWNWRCRK